MSIELRLLAYSVALLFVLIVIQASAGVLAHGSKTMAGPRDVMPADTKFQSRGKRTVANHIEGLALFAPLVLIAAIAHVSNEWTVLGARLFFYSRLAHAVLYLAGVPWLRALAWFVGVIGTVMVFLAVVGVI